METLERKILMRLAKAREHQETNINLNTIWKECGDIAPSEFATAWGSLEAAELVHGELYSSTGSIDGLGKITAKGDRALRN
jgi:hypothetical protein